MCHNLNDRLRRSSWDQQCSRRSKTRSIFASNVISIVLYRNLSIFFCTTFEYFDLLIILAEFLYNMAFDMMIYYGIDRFQRIPSWPCSICKLNILVEYVLIVLGICEKNYLYLLQSNDDNHNYDWISFINNCLVPINIFFK